MEHANRYLLGHSDEEQARLLLQSRMIDEFMFAALARAGVTAGQHVLDVGCGVGNVSLLAAAAVGPGGSVTGVDMNPEVIGVARERARHGGLSNVRFEVAALEDFQPPRAFDAVIGRMVLAHVAEPADTLQRLSRCVAPGGLMLFQEADGRGVGATPAVAEVTELTQWITSAFERAGARPHMGSQLYSMFHAARLPAPKLWCDARMEGGPDSEVYVWLANTVRSVLPLLERHGITTAERVQIDTLAQRIRERAIAAAACVSGPWYVTAWTRLPAY
jgi:ubiquinone/menaquinone biosynthesis C-methylase UbiE